MLLVSIQVLLFRLLFIVRFSYLFFFFCQYFLITFCTDLRFTMVPDFHSTFRVFQTKKKKKIRNFILDKFFFFLFFISFCCLRWIKFCSLFFFFFFCPKVKFILRSFLIALSTFPITRVFPKESSFSGLRSLFVICFYHYYFGYLRHCF